MIKKIFMCFYSMALTLVLVSHSSAMLSDRGGGLLYDSDLDITWLQNANFAGLTMTWYEANTWAEDLTYGGYSDWRLPITDTSCSGSSCSGSEMGHLFYDEGITSSTTAMFLDVRPYYYWSSSDDETDSAKAWRFNFKSDSGLQGTSSKTLKRYAWAVRNGDSTTPVAPEPVSSILFITGGGIIGIRRLLVR